VAGRSHVVSSFTIVKGTLIEETYTVFRGWDCALSKAENLKRAREGNTIAATSANWALNVAKTLNRRFDPAGRDRALVELAKAGCPREVWKPLLLYHMTRDEFLVRDFLINWLYPQFTKGTYRLSTEEVVGYLKTLESKKDIKWSGQWSESTTSRVAAGLLRLTADFGLLTGTVHKEFVSYHLPEESFLYLLHAMMEKEANARRVIFTQRYVVQFLTDNTLGRTWCEMRRGDTQLAQLDYLVTDEAIPERAPKDPRDLRILDPACGSGHFLLYAFDLLAGDPSRGSAGIYEEAWRSESTPPSKATGRALREDYGAIDALRRAVPELILRHNLYGVDIDPRAVQIAALALWMRAQRAYNAFDIATGKRPRIARTNIVTAEPMPGDRSMVADFAATLRPKSWASFSSAWSTR